MRDVDWEHEVTVDRLYALCFAMLGLGDIHVCAYRRPLPFRVSTPRDIRRRVCRQGRGILQSFVDAQSQDPLGTELCRTQEILNEFSTGTHCNRPSNIAYIRMISRSPRLLWIILCITSRLLASQIEPACEIAHCLIFRHWVSCTRPPICCGRLIHLCKYAAFIIAVSLR